MTGKPLMRQILRSAKRRPMSVRAREWDAKAHQSLYPAANHICLLSALKLLKSYHTLPPALKG
eukprot:5315937-Heterocapsa_arctica.AAC.1